MVISSYNHQYKNATFYEAGYVTQKYFRVEIQLFTVGESIRTICFTFFGKAWTCLSTQL